MLKINGITVKTPSSLGWGLMDLSSEDSGRTLDGVMHKDIIAQKRKLDPVWESPTADETKTILQLVCPNVYISVTYPDPLTGQNETKTFYTGDKTAPYRIWTANEKAFSSLSFNFIEK